MTIISGIGKKFSEEMPLQIHALSEGSPSSDVIKVALYGPNAILGPTVDSYTTSNEIVGGGYSAGGITILGLTVVGAQGSSRNAGPQYDFAYIQPTEDTVFAVSGVAIRGCMMYNSTQGNRNIFTMNFGDTIIPAVGLTISWGLAGVTGPQRTLMPIVGQL